MNCQMSRLSQNPVLPFIHLYSDGNGGASTTNLKGVVAILRDFQFQFFRTGNKIQSKETVIPHMTTRGEFSPSEGGPGGLGCSHRSPSLPHTPERLPLPPFLPSSPTQVALPAPPFQGCTPFPVEIIIPPQQSLWLTDLAAPKVHSSTPSPPNA